MAKFSTERCPYVQAQKSENKEAEAIILKRTKTRERELRRKTGTYLGWGDGVVDRQSGSSFVMYVVKK